MSADDNEHHFLWLSDVHFDPYYSTPQAFQSSYYDAGCHETYAPPFGKYGCDSPRSLVHSALEYAVNITSTKATKPAFVVLSGDLIRHGVDQLYVGGDFKEGAEGRSDNNSTNSTTLSSSSNYSPVEAAAHASWHTQAMEEAGDILHELVSIVQSSFPESEIIVSIGNNDVVPDYYLQLFDDVTTIEDAGMLGVIFNALSTNNSTIDEDEPTKTKTILTPDDKGTFLRGGYYSRNLHNGTLTILSLNTVLYSSFFGPVSFETNDDPGMQFSWMRSVLKSCRELGTRAIIVGHIPPSMGSYRHTQLWREEHMKTYYDIVREFDELIIGQLFGHLHSDEFRVGMLEPDEGETNATISMIPYMNTPILLGESITPLHANNPSIRLVKYDLRGGGRLLDYDSHQFSINTDSQWSKLYTFSEEYTAASRIIKEEGLSSSVFRATVDSMEDKRGRESPMLALYRSFMLSGAEGDAANRGGNAKCDSVCREEFICTFQTATSVGQENCLNNGSWKRNGRSIFGLVGATFFGIVVVSFVIVRCRRRNKRDEYESTPSVTGTGQEDDEIDAKDQEMI